MSNPTEGPFGEAAKIPLWGDPEILPKGRIERPSADRMPFGPSGELLPDGPKLPAGFLLAPDIKDLPWQRRRGDEWTDAVFRQIVFTFLIAFFRDRDWPKKWTVAERATSERMSTRRLPEDKHFLIIGVIDAAKVRSETAASFPVAKRDATSARVILDRMAAALDQQAGQ